MAFLARTEASCCADVPVVFLGTDATTTTCNLSSSRAGPAGDAIVSPRQIVDFARRRASDDQSLLADSFAGA